MALVCGCGLSNLWIWDYVGVLTMMGVAVPSCVDLWKNSLLVSLQTPTPAVWAHAACLTSSTPQYQQNKTMNGKCLLLGFIKLLPFYYQWCAAVSYMHDFPQGLPWTINGNAGLMQARSTTVYVVKNNGVRGALYLSNVLHN